MPRRTIMLLPVPTDVEDLVQVLTDVSRGWAAARVDVDNGSDVLTITASRRRAQRPDPGEGPEDDVERQFYEAVAAAAGARRPPILGDTTPDDGTALDPEPHGTPIVVEPAETPLSGPVIPASADEPEDPFADQRPGRWDDLPDGLLVHAE